MSEDENVHPQASAAAEAPLPAMPEPFEFNLQLLQQWLEIPKSDQIVAPLTRQDIDHLLFGLLRGIEAQSSLEAVLVHWSQGQTEEANKKLLDFRRLNIESLNNVRQFFSGLMISAVRERSRAKQ